MNRLISRAAMDTPLGKATAAIRDEALIGFWFAGQKHYPQAAASWPEQAEHPLFSSLRAWLDGYFAGARTEPDFPLRPQGTDFQKAVWDILRRIPYGTLSTYGAIAAQLAGARKAASLSARAVGGAVGRNPVSLLIPCHRVVGTGGGLTGYAGGLEKKKALLRLEGLNPPA